MIVAEGGWNLGVTKGASVGVCTSLKPKSLRLKISLLSKPKLGLLTAFCGMGLMGLFGATGLSEGTSRPMIPLLESGAVVQSVRWDGRHPRGFLVKVSFLRGVRPKVPLNCD